MSKKYLVTRPEYDETTHYLSKWCEKTIEFAEQKGIKVLDLQGSKANRKETEAMLNQSPELVVLNGHGTDTLVYGHEHQPIIVADENENLLKSKIVYALSCKSAKTLGMKSVNAGAINYTGYDEDFVMLHETDKVSRPLSDNLAKLFLEPSNLLIISLLKGNTVEEAKQKAEDVMRKNVLSSLNSPEPYLTRYLWWNLKHFVTNGKTDARI